MPLINCKVELKLKWTNHCVLSAAGHENEINSDNNNADNIIFITKDTRLYVPAVTLSARDNQKAKKLISKGFGRSVYWNEYITKSEKIKILQINLDVFLYHILLESIFCFS